MKQNLDMKNYRFYLVFLLTLSFSCENTNELVDTDFEMKYYDSKGNLLSFGMMNKDSLKIGKWVDIRDDSLKNVYEYLIIEDDEYLNQHWVVNENNDVLDGHFVDDYNIKDTVLLNDVYTFRFVLHPLFSTSSEFLLLYSDQLKDDYSNFNKVEMDTIKNLYITANDKDQYSNLMIEFDLKLDKLGKFKLNGVFLEINNDEELKRVREIFYTKEIYVKAR